MLCFLCKYSSLKKKKGSKKTLKPDYLHKFLEFVVKNLNEYNGKVQSGEGADWRIKEALLFSISTLKEEIMSQKDLRQNIEQMLMTYVLPELTSNQPFMRLRACQVYGVYGSVDYKIDSHVQQIAEGIFKNMHADQPLPVKFHAACALEKILENDNAMNYIKPGLDVVLKTYLTLMTELDNEELVAAFEQVVATFETMMGPFACDICEHLKEQYIRLIKQDQEADDDGETILTAVASFTSIRRIIDAIQSDMELLKKVEKIVYPVLLHSLTADGLDSIEEGIDCISMLIHYG